jgi:hypothetical protein
MKWYKPQWLQREVSKIVFTQVHIILLEWRYFFMFFLLLVYFHSFHTFRNKYELCLFNERLLIAYYCSTYRYLPNYLPTCSYSQFTCVDNVLPNWYLCEFNLIEVSILNLYFRNLHKRIGKRRKWVRVVLRFYESYPYPYRKMIDSN